MNGMKMIAVAGLVMVAGVAWGQVEWVNIYEHPNPLVPCEVIRTRDGGFVFAGSQAPGVFLFKVDEAGDSLWWRSYFDSIWVHCTSMIETEDGGFALAGYLRTENWDDYWLLRVDENGEELWSRSYGQGRDESEKCTALLQTADGGFALYGWYNTFNVNVLHPWLLITNRDGDSLWSRIYDPPYMDIMARGQDGGYLFAGYSRVVKADSTGEVEWVYGDERVHKVDAIIPAGVDWVLAGTLRENNLNFAIRLSVTGDVVWFKSYRASMHSMSSIVEAYNGGFLIGGNGPYFLRIDANGDSLWRATYRGGELISNCSVESVPNEGFVIGGRIFNPKFGVFLLKTTDQPFNIQIPGDSLSAEDSAPILPSIVSLLPPYPNPFNSTVTIPFVSGSAIQPTRLMIFDPLGRRVAELIPPGTVGLPAGKYSVVWDASGYAAGLYLIELQSDDQRIERQVILTK